MKRVTRLRFLDQTSRTYKISVADREDTRVRGVVTAGRDVYVVIEENESANFKDPVDVLTLYVAPDGETFDLPNDTQYVDSIYHDRDAQGYHIYLLP